MQQQVLAVSQGIRQDVKSRKLRVHPRPPPSSGRRARAGAPPHAIRGAGNNGAMNRIRPSSFLNGQGGGSDSMAETRR
jgi:hypothetical protein